jgi:hypothetical protein
LLFAKSEQPTAIARSNLQEDPAMATAPSIGVPELAGVATYEDAARIGYSVDDNVRRLLRLHWTERRLMALSVAHLTATPEWEVKCGLALHQWQDAEHADALRRRIAEMRNPLPRLDEPPDASLDALFDEALRAGDTIELLAGAYGILRQALTDAYERHLTETNPLVDQPTRRLMRFALLEEQDALAWAERALDALSAGDSAARERALAWQRHLQAFLDAAGGIAGDLPRSSTTPAPRAATPFVPDFHPRRDGRFQGLYAFDYPPHTVYNDPRVPADERNLALLCKRTLEMDVPEMMASFLTERADQPWEFYLDYSRQLWDECRHAMMGTAALEARGVDWTTIPLNVGFALRLNLHATPLERQVLLFAIEQSLMPGETGKRAEYETAVAAGDALSAHFHDYDWADEVLHARIGRRLLKREGISPPDATARGAAIHEKTWAALDRYRRPGEQRDWWSAFVLQVLGKPSEARVEEGGVPKVIAE